MTQALAINPNSDVIESVITAGDLSRLNPVQRVNYYTAVCQSVGLNPLTKPFEYITLNGKMVLYARKDATDQLRDIRKVSITRLERERIDSVYVVTAYAQTVDGRTDSSMGAVNIEGLKGDALANALMKSETKAKRRVTLSICGLGMLDETELSTIPDARPANVNLETGEIVQPARTVTIERPVAQTKPSTGPSWTQDAANDAAFEAMPSASAERNGGNGKAAPANGALWQTWHERGDAIDFAVEHGLNYKHAMNLWNKLQTEGKLATKDVYEPFYAAVTERPADKPAKVQEPTDAELDAQAASEELPVFESR